MSGRLTFGAPAKGWPTFGLKGAGNEDELTKAQLLVRYPAGISYVSGPMRGKTGCNFDAFDAAEVPLREAGLYTFSPARHDRQRGHVPPPDTDCSSEYIAAVVGGATMDGLILWDLEVLLTKVTDIHLLPGWEDSSGANLEVAAAQFAKLRIWLPTLDYEAGGEPAWDKAAW